MLELDPGAAAGVEFRLGLGVVGVGGGWIGVEGGCGGSVDFSVVFVFGVSFGYVGRWSWGIPWSL